MRLARSVAFVGLPGAGKSTVGRAVAARLGCACVDFDERLAVRAGQSVAEVFATQGESAFRKMELALTEELLAEPPAVWAPGGGWLPQPAVMALVLGRVGIVHLLVSPAGALARLEQDASIRPLLTGGEAGPVLERLWQERRAAYGRADLALDTEELGIQQLVDRACAFATSGLGDAD